MYTVKIHRQKKTPNRLFLKFIWKGKVPEEQNNLGNKNTKTENIYCMISDILQSNSNQDNVALA